MAARMRRQRRLSRRTALLLFILAMLAGLALVWAGSAWADPNPTPGPAPTAPGAPTTAPAPGPSATPSPSARVTPSPISAPPTNGPSSPSTGSDDDPAWYDIGGQIRKAVVDLVVWAANQALQPVMAALGQSWLSTPDLTTNPQVTAFWATSLVTANGVFVLFIVAGGFLVTARETLQTRHGLKQVMPRIAVGAVLTNCSLILCAKAIEWTNALTVAIAGNTVDGPTVATAIRQIVDNALKGDGFMMALLVIAVIVMCLILEFTFVVRLAALVLLIGIAPAALICHASPLTEGIAHTWWRAFAACLGLQLGQAIVVMATVKVFLTPTGPSALGLPTTEDGLLGVLVCITMLWILIKLPGWMRQFVLGPLGQQGGRGLIGQLIHAYLTIKTLGAASGLLRGASAAGAAGTSSGRTTTPRPSGPRPSPARPARPPRPSPPRPSPAGPAAFSHAPITQAPLPAPSGTNGPPTFSDQPSPAASSPGPVGGVPAAQFSHPSPAELPRSAPVTRPARVGFSDAAPGPASRSTAPRPAPTGATPAVAFSAAPVAQSAPRRPPAPVTPVFSAAPSAGTTGGPRRAATPGSRPTAARRGTPPAGAAGSATPSAATPPPARKAAVQRAPVAGTPPVPPSQARRAPAAPPSPGGRRSANPSPPPSPTPTPRTPSSPPAPRPDESTRTASSAPPVRAVRPAPPPASSTPLPSPPPSPAGPRPSPPSRRRPRERGNQP